SAELDSVTRWQTDFLFDGRFSRANPTVHVARFKVHHQGRSPMRGIPLDGLNSFSGFEISQFSQRQHSMVTDAYGKGAQKVEIFAQVWMETHNHLPRTAVLGNERARVVAGECHGNRLIDRGRVQI